MARARTKARAKKPGRVGPKIAIGTFQAADYLKSEIAIRAFPAAAMEDPNRDVLLAALSAKLTVETA